MTDIPINKLMDKLETGWSVRRKIWKEGLSFWKLGGNITPTISDYYEDDWEGEPPEVKCLSEKLHMVAAFTLLQEGTVKFIRRPSWDKCKLFKHSVMCFALNYEDIQTSDWEVWA